MSVAEGALRAGQDAAARAGVTVRIAAPADYPAVRRVFDTVWPDSGGSTQVQPNLMRATQHSGGYVSACVDSRSGEVAGAAYALAGRHRAEEGWQGHLHSHMAAVLPGWRDRGVGLAMKLHQRWWALDQGVPIVAWTFDPLVRRNAWFNLARLGCHIAEFHPDFYGDMDDGVNSGDLTDRLLAWWVVASPRATAAASGRLAVRGGADWAESGARHLLGVVDGRPAVSAAVPGVPAMLAWLPEDIVALRAADPAAARDWRLALREALVTAGEAGYVVDAVTAEGAYVLVPRDGWTLSGS